MAIDLPAAAAMSYVAHLPHAWFVANAVGRILYRNHAAARWLDGSGPFVDHDGVLHLVPKAAHARFRRCLAEATEAAARHDLAMVAGLTIERADRQLPAIVLVAPVCGGPEPLASVTIVDPSRRVDGLAGLLAQLFDLSDAERRVAVGIANGMRLADIALEAGVQPSTVRTQLKALLRKTGARRQLDIVRLVHGALARPMPAAP